MRTGVGIGVVRAGLTALNAYVGSADFSTLVLGGNATLPGGWSFARSGSGATVQTGANVVVSGIAADTARGGRLLATDPVSLVIEEARTNLAKQSRDITPVTYTSGGTITALTRDQTGVDGAANTGTRVAGAANSFRVQAVAVTTATAYVGSVWLAGTSVGINVEFAMSGLGLLGTGIANIGDTLYRRYTLAGTTTGASVNVFPYDARGNGTFVGPPFAAGARDQIIDLLQLEQGLFQTEAIPTVAASVTRSGERLYNTTGSGLVDSGRVSLYVSLQPKGASGGYAANMRLVSIDANNYAEIDASTRAVRVVVGGVSYVTPVAMAWAANDLIDLYVAFGGSAPCNVQYRVNSGAATKLSTGSPTSFGTVTVAGALDALCNGTANQFSARVRRLDFYSAGLGPVWLV